MFALRRLFALVAVAATVKALGPRQTTNTNAAISAIIDPLDETMHHVGPNIRTRFPPLAHVDPFDAGG
jgi:hypothetical protein